MRILLLSDINSAHTQKWVRGLCAAGMEVGLFSLSNVKESWYSGLENFTLCYAPAASVNTGSLRTKLGYALRVGMLKKAIRSFAPDIVHAHYATSYGLLGALSGFRPFVISVWGSDVYDFPNTNFSYGRLLRYILSRPDLVCSTSNSMADETRKYTSRPLVTIPFGLDTAEFREVRTHTFDPNGPVTIGCIKALTPKYGTDYLLRAFRLVKERKPETDLRLLVVGSGTHSDQYRQLAGELGISEYTEFTGNVPHATITRWHARIDIFVCLSILDSESFGVALVEAMASGSCVVASDVSGFREVLKNGNELGLLVPRRSAEAAADAICEILNNPEEARQRARRAFESVQERYEWKENLAEMIAQYEKLLKR